MSLACNMVFRLRQQVLLGVGVDLWSFRVCLSDQMLVNELAGGGVSRRWVYHEMQKCKMLSLSRFLAKQFGALCSDESHSHNSLSKLWIVKKV